MRVSRGWLCAFFLALTALLCWSTAAAQALSVSTGDQAYSRDAALVIPGAQWLFGYEQMQAQAQAKRANPIAAEARDASALRFAGLSATQASALARSSFPDLVSHPDGGLPKLAPGERMGRIVGDSAVSVRLPGGRHGVVESLEPISVKTRSGRVPIDLSLRESGGEFVPKTPVAGLKLTIPRQLSAAPALHGLGVSLLPVDRRGVALPSAGGVVDGATVFYGNSEHPGSGVLDMDTLVKPETLGFSEETILRSERSPKRLFFKVGLPKGAHLSQPQGAGPVRVMRAGRVLATLAAPAALDAEGTAVPLSLTFSGDTLTVTLDRHPGQYRFPIAVDPNITDWQLNISSGKPTNWHFTSHGSAFTGSENSGGAGWTEHVSGSYSEADWGGFAYTTQGISHIRSFSIEGSWHDPANVINELLIFAPGKVEAQEELPSEWTSGGTWGRCAPEPGCTGAQSGNNSVEWIQNPNANGSGTGENTLTKTTVTIEQASGPELTFNKTSPTLAGGVPNILYGSGGWLGPGTGFEANAYDPGIGISYFGIAGGTKGYVEKFALLEKGECLGGVQCEEHFNPVFGYSPLLPDGEVSLEAGAYDAAGSSAFVWPLKIKVDGTAPHNIVISGLPSNHQIGLKPYTLKAEASDGSGTLASSGIKSIALSVDGRQVGTASGSCSPGPCTANSGSWTINGSEYSGGEHVLEVTATDNAGNVATEDVTIAVPVAHPIPLGPGQVVARSGEYLLQATDVAQGEGLAVSRSYGSQHLTDGVDGPLGPQWVIGMGSMESLEVQANGSVNLTDDNGRRVGFAKNGSGGFISPAGDSNLTLSFHEVGGVKEYVLANAAKGTSTRFTLPSGGGTLWMPTIQEGDLATETTTYTYETVEISGKKVTRPIKALAPVPAGVSCSPEMKAGCRALTFNYATTTTATGEGSSEWGDYTGNLTRVYVTAYDPTSKAMSTVAVAQYAYDTKGQLRAEWDPRVSPALKEEYGYDAEGHVTALTPPGQETWAFTYGGIPSDTTPGRLLRTTQAPASASLWSGSAPHNTAAPAITPEIPTMGVSASASAGTWSGSPVAYRYQWQRCNSAGESCVAIAGATNEAYNPSAADFGRKLRVEVQATNGGGSNVAYSAASKVIAFSLSYQSKFGSSGTGSGQFKWAQGVTVDSSGNVWVADTFNNRVQEFNSSGTFVREFGTTGTGNGQFKEPFGIAINSEGNLWVTDAGNNRVQEFSSTGTYIKQFGTTGSGAGQLSWPNGITITPEGNIWVADTQNNRVEEFSSTGSYIRVAGGFGSGNGQLSGPKDVASDAYGNIWVTDTKNNRVQEFSSTGSYERKFGSEGSGHGQFKESRGITVDSSGEIWVTDRTNGRVQGFNANGEYLTQYGGEGQFNEPEGIAVTGSGTVYVADTSNQMVQILHLSGATPLAFSSTFSAYSGAEPTSWQQDLAFDVSGNVWVADALSNHINEFSASGTYLGRIGSPGSGTGQLSTPEGLVFTSEGNIWVADTKNNRLEEFETSGQYLRQFGSVGSGSGQFSAPRGVAILPGSGDIVVADVGNNRVEVFGPTGTFIREITGGSTPFKLKGANAVATDPSGNIWVADTGDNRVVEFSSTGENIRQFGSTGSGRGQFNGPSGITIDPSGNVWVTDTYNNRIEGFSATGEFLAEYGVYGSGNGQFYDPMSIAVNSSSGVFYVLDSGRGRVQKFTVPVSTSEPAATPRTEGGALTTVEYNVPVSGSGAPHEMGSSEAALWGQTDVPNEAIAIYPPDEPVGWPAADYKRATVYYLDEKERLVNVASPAGGISTSEYNEANDLTRELSPDNRASALAEGAKSAEVSRTLDTQSTYSSDGTELLSTLGPRHTVKLANGESVSARQHSVYSYDEGAPEGGPYRLVTKATEGAQIEGKPEQDVRTTTTSYSGQSNLGWTLRAPTSVTTDPSGLKLTSTFIYDSATGNVLETRKPGSGGESNPHDIKTVYYSSAANEAYPACGGHPEWAYMVCETLPAAQPETGGIPNLPVTTTTYNVWGEPATVTRTVGADSRTTTNTYDEGGRLTKSSISSTVGTSLPSVTDEYESSTGLLNKTKTTVEGVTSSLTSGYNTLGQLTSYTDADGAASTYEYDIDGRTTFVNDAKGTQSYTYSTTSGLETELYDSAVHKVTATYDVEGNLLTEKAPDGITKSFTYNAVGEVTSVTDKKITSCGSSCTWFSQTETPSIHGQTASQSTTLVQDGYKYDEAGRLTEVTETPTGQGCLTRLYGFDAEDNETSLTSREPAAEGKCATTGGTTTSRTYDSGNRLIDTGVKYDSFGDTTALPAGDAGGSELTSSFYADSRLASLSQAGETISYRLDPSRRTRETVATGTTSSTIVNHYSGGGDSPSWTVDLAGKWTRYIAGIGTGLLAIQYNGESPTMQLSDIESNIVATASSSSTATALLSTTRNTEFGVPTSGSPAKYSWLGADQRPVELPSGVVAMGARGYVPQIGRFLQMDPLAGGSANPYAYTDGDPVNSTDLSGAYVESDYLDEFNEEQKERAVERRIAEEEAAREEAERKAEEAAEAAAAAAEAAAEAAAGGGGGGRRGHHQHHGGGVKAPRVAKIRPYSTLCKYGCSSGKLKCSSACHERRKKEDKRKRKKEEKEEEFEDKHPCPGHELAVYHGNATASGSGTALYLAGSSELRYIENAGCEPGDGGDPTGPCVSGCEGGLEAWQLWPGEPADPRRRDLLAVRA